MNHNGYMDLHSHILPGIDDGSRQMEMTGEMIQRAYEQGVRTLVATPHNYPGKRHPDGKAVLELLERVRQQFQDRYPDLKLLAGNEILYRDSIVEELEQQKVLSLNQGRYVLVEFYPKEGYPRIFSGVKELLENGYYPILAHVERIGTLMEQEKHLDELLEMGCYFQSNCEAFLGGIFHGPTRKMIRRMNQGKVHFLGSDAHNLTSRPPMMETCVERLRKKVDEDILEQILVKNPEKLLNNRCI